MIHGEHGSAVAGWELFLHGRRYYQDWIITLIHSFQKNLEFYPDYQPAYVMQWWQPLANKLARSYNSALTPDMPDFKLGYNKCFDKDDLTMAAYYLEKELRPFIQGQFLSPEDCYINGFHKKNGECYFCNNGTYNPSTM
jgi:hypothetical protein